MGGRTLKVGWFGSAPWAPFYDVEGVWKDVEFVDCVSSGVAALAMSGGVDVTPLATVDWFDLDDRFVRMGSHGLAYREQARSVLLFSEQPIEALDGSPLAISTETTTSVRVLRAILRDKYKLSLGPLVAMSSGLPTSIPRLLIQDQAVDELTRRRFAHVHDLGHEWWSWQKLPIVSAVWVARRDLDAAELRRAESMLDAALGWSSKHPHEMAQRFMARSTLGTTEEALLTLAGNFRYRLGPLEEQGIEAMKRLLEPRESIDRAYASQQNRSGT